MGVPKYVLQHQPEFEIEFATIDSILKKKSKNPRAFAYSITYCIKIFCPFGSAEIATKSKSSASAPTPEFLFHHIKRTKKHLILAGSKIIFGISFR